MRGSHRPQRWPGVALTLALTLLGVIPGCAPDRRRITPTTTGSDLRNLPRGRMTPLPFPGSSIAHEDTRPNRDSPRLDPSMALAALKLD